MEASSSWHEDKKHRHNLKREVQNGFKEKKICPEDSQAVEQVTREVVQSTLSDVFKARLDKALHNSV